MQYVSLNDGNKMPQLGFGVLQINDLSLAEQAVSQAIEVGYRLFDTAAAYGNEAAVGKAIAKSGLPREDFFVTSKLWVDHASYEKADVVGAWRALEEAQAAGKIRSIGVSNFYADQIKNLELMSRVQPAVNQIEVSPWYQQACEAAFMQGEGIAVEAWAPFAEGKGGIFTNEQIAQIGQKYGKSNGQVILRWLLQRGIIVIPKSVHYERMAENFAIFDFELTDAEMSLLKTLDKNESQFFSHRDPAAIESIFGASLRALRN